MSLDEEAGEACFFFFFFFCFVRSEFGCKKKDGPTSASLPQHPPLRILSIPCVLDQPEV